MRFLHGPAERHLVRLIGNAVVDLIGVMIHHRTAPGTIHRPWFFAHSVTFSRP